MKAFLMIHREVVVTLIAACLTGCGIPVSISGEYVSPDSGATFKAAYSDKQGITVEATNK